MSDEQRPHPGLRKLSSYGIRPTSWLMPERIPYGHLTILGGQAGEGKSTMTMALAAHVTQRGMSVVFVGGEDDPASCVRPRLLASGGDDDRLHIFGDELDPTFPEDSEFLERAVTDSGAGLLIIDPISAHLSPALNTANDHSLRQGLRPLARIAQRTRAAVIVVMHMNKGREGSPLNWLSGSGGFGGIARSVLLFGTARDDAADLSRQHIRYLHHVKSNLGPLRQPLCCQIDGANVDIGEGTGEVVTTSRLTFGQEDPHAHPGDLR